MATAESARRGHSGRDWTGAAARRFAGAAFEWALLIRLAAIQREA